jgi:hypothetical protein
VIECGQRHSEFALAIGQLFVQLGHVLKHFGVLLLSAWPINRKPLHVLIRAALEELSLECFIVCVIIAYVGVRHPIVFAVVEVDFGRYLGEIVQWRITLSIVVIVSPSAVVILTEFICQIL